jgi:hypothetical protein
MEDQVQRHVRRVWVRFRIAWWTLLAVCLVLVLIGQFLAGLLVGITAAGVNIAWREWGWRVEADYRRRSR